MAYDPDMFGDDDAEALKAERRAELEALRARLRAKAARLVEVIETMGDPETVSDAWRAVRLVRQADHMLVQLHAEPEEIMPSMARRSGSGSGSGSGSVTSARMAEAVDKEIEARKAHRERQGEEMLRIMRALSVGQAQDCGFWPNGDVFEGDDGSDSRLSPSIDHNLPPAQDLTDHFRHYVIRCTNASLYHQAKAKGQWPDASPFDPEADNTSYYRITEGDQYKTEDEEYVGGTMPWWVVRKLPPKTAPP